MRYIKITYLLSFASRDKDWGGGMDYGLYFRVIGFMCSL